MMEVKTVSDKFLEFVEYAISHHSRTLQNHRQFIEQMNGVLSGIKNLEAGYQRVLDAAYGRGMVSELANMQEAAVLVCGLYDRIAEQDELKQSPAETKEEQE